MSPTLLTATPAGPPIEALSAATGVGGGAPPATVEIEYCCPKAAELTERTAIARRAQNITLLFHRSEAKAYRYSTQLPNPGRPDPPWQLAETPQRRRRVSPRG